MIEIFPEAKNDKYGITCDNCHKEFMVWFRKLSDNEKKEIQARSHRSRQSQ